MTCLKNYIQIQGCDAPVYDGGGSGLYLNKELSISLEQMDKIADGEQVTFLGVWDEVQDRAIRKFIVRVKAGFKELFNVCNLDDAWFCENKDSLALPLLYFLGSELMFERMYSSRINRYTTIDRKKAQELKEAFDNEFVEELKSALQIIGHVEHKTENGEVFTYVESLP